TAEERDATVPRGHRDRLLLGDVRGGGGDDDVGTTAPGQLHDPLDDVDLRAVDGLVRLDGFGGHLQTLGVHVDQVDRTALVHTAGDPDVHAPDRAGPEHDDGVAGLDAEQLLGVDRAGERLGGRGLVVPHVVGDAVQPVDREHLARHDHVFGEPAVVLVA